MKLTVESSESFSAAEGCSEIDVAASGESDVDALVRAVGTALGANVTEVFFWDDDFEEFVLLEKAGDLQEGKIQVTVEATEVEEMPAEPEPEETAAELEPEPGPEPEP